MEWQKYKMYTTNVVSGRHQKKIDKPRYMRREKRPPRGRKPAREDTISFQATREQHAMEQIQFYGTALSNLCI
jgi:hypothetical protein